MASKSGELKIVWVGTKRRVGLKQERKAIRRYGDAILSSGPVRLRGKLRSGYAVSILKNRKK